jgi:hypothetical protein
MIRTISVLGKPFETGVWSPNRQPPRNGVAQHQELPMMYRFAQAFAVLGVSMWFISWLGDFLTARRRREYPISPSETELTNTGD